MWFFSWRRVGVFLLAASLVAGLATACEQEEGPPTPTPTVTPAVTPAVSPTPRPEGPPALDLAIFGPSFQQAEPITLVLTVTAYGPLTLYYRTSQRYDFLVATADGQEVWRWSREQAFLQVLEQVSLQAGESVAYSEVWDQRDNEGNPLPPGDYLVVGESSHCDSNYENCGQRTAPQDIQIQISAP